MFHLNNLQSNNSIEFHQRRSTMMIICNFFFEQPWSLIFLVDMYLYTLFCLTWLGMAVLLRFISVINFQNVFHCQYFWSNHNVDSALNTYSLFVRICFARFKWFYANSETKAVSNFISSKNLSIFFSCSLFLGEKIIRIIIKTWHSKNCNPRINRKIQFTNTFYKFNLLAIMKIFEKPEHRHKSFAWMEN